AANVGEAANVAEHFAEFIGPLPRDGPGADTPRADTANGPAVRVFGEVQFLADFRQDFFEQEAGVLIAQRIVFEAAIAARLLARLGRRHFARIDEDADGRWHFLLRDEIVEHDRHAKL